MLGWKISTWFLLRGRGFLHLIRIWKQKKIFIFFPIIFSFFFSRNIARHYYHKKANCASVFCTRYFVHLDILRDIFGLTKREMIDIKFDEVFDTHLRNQDKDYGDNLDVLCFIKCLVAPFREPSNFFYWFALCDTNCSGGLDNLEFKRLIGKMRAS